MCPTSERTRPLCRVRKQNPNPPSRKPERAVMRKSLRCELNPRTEKTITLTANTANRRTLPGLDIEAGSIQRYPEKMASAFFQKRKSKGFDTKALMAMTSTNEATANANQALA